MSNYTLYSPIDIKGAPATTKFFNTTLTNSVTVTSPPALTGNVTFPLPGTNGVSGNFLRFNTGGTTTWETGTNDPNKSTPMFYGAIDQINTDNAFPITIGNTSIVHFYYGGTNSGSILHQAKIVLRFTTLNPIRIIIRDNTNAQDIINIAYTPILINTTYFINLTPISGTPSATPALWELIFGFITVANTVTFYSLNLY